MPLKKVIYILHHCHSKMRFLQNLKYQNYKYIRKKCITRISLISLIYYGLNNIKVILAPTFSLNFITDRWKWKSADFCLQIKRKLNKAVNISRLSRFKKILDNRLNLSLNHSPNHIKNFHLSKGVCHGEYEWQDPKSPEEIVNVTYIDKDGKEIPIKGKIGDNLMYLAHRYDIPMEGACEASLACTTCHVYVLNFSEKLPPAEEKEEDLLDMAPFLKENSRLGCQIILNKDLNGLKVQLPKATRNFYVDGHKPKPH